MRKFHPLAGCLAALAGLAVSCGPKARAPSKGSVVSARAVPSERLPATSDQFVTTKCRVALSDYATECGYVLVSEEPKSERLIALSVMRVFSNADEVSAEPVVYLEGGPGASTLSDAEPFVAAFEGLLEHRDLILFDQRGVGQTLPALDCTERELASCYQSLSKEVSLSAYNSKRNAADVDAIREALGYKSWNLYGISYGTRLGLTVLRDFPAGVRAAVFDSVVPLQIDLIANLATNAQSAFEKVFAAGAADAECDAKYPDLLGKLRETVVKLNETPRELAAGPLTGDGYLGALFNYLYSVPVIEMMPLIVTNVAKGDYKLFDSLSRGSLFTDSSFSFPMHLSLHCAEEVPFTSEALVKQADANVLPEFVGGMSGETYLGYCSEWPVKPANPAENEPVTSSRPQLYFAGYFDPITPVAYTKLAADDQPNAGYFEVERGSHGASVSSCGLAMISEFFDAPTRVPDGSCLNEEPTLRFQSIAGAPNPRRLRFRYEEPDDAALEQLRSDLSLRTR